MLIVQKEEFALGVFVHLGKRIRTVMVWMRKRDKSAEKQSKSTKQKTKQKKLQKQKRKKSMTLLTNYVTRFLIKIFSMTAITKKTPSRNVSKMPPITLHEMPVVTNKRN